MKIRTKILFGYVLLSGLVLAVGLAGLYATRSVGTNFNRAVNETQPVLRTLQDIRLMATRLLTAPHGAAAGGKGAGLAELDGANRRYQGLVQRYFPAERTEAAEIDAKVAAVRAAAEGDRSELAARIRELLDGTTEIIADEELEFAAYQRSVDKEIASQAQMILIVSLLGFLATLVGGVRLSTRLSRPIIALRDAARRLGAGHLDARVAAAGTAEVGELAQAFNAMAERLGNSMVSREYVECIIESMAEGIVVVDSQGRVERVNRAFRQLFRAAPEHVFAGQRLADYFPDLATRGNSQGAGGWIEMAMRTAAGEAVAVGLSSADLRAGDGAAGTVILVQDITERKANEERLLYLARYDALTGLPNRTLLLDHLGQSLARQPWKTSRTAILFCDLDRFKFVNDTLGHAIGDLLLQRVGERLQRCVRPGDIVARWAGDEFVILLNDIAQADDAVPLAEKVVDQLREPVQIGPHELYVTVSVGISLAPVHATRSDELVKCADMAMYAAKADGKNTCRVYALGMAEASQERLRLEGALRQALKAGDQLQVHYQAQRWLDGRLIGFEALVRWQHPELGLIAPASFLPLAEESGLMAAIDETVLRAACGQARRWQEAGLAGLRVAVNISNDLFSRGNLPSLVGALLAEYELPPCALELELTEAIVMADIENSIRTMERIRALGVQLSIDDFGTGYSSLSHLKRCPIQMVKIDRSFISDVITDPNDAAITEAIVALAHKMGIQVLAEGVESQDQLDVLKGYGCDALQGYLLSRPLPADRLPELIARLHPAGGGAAPAPRAAAATA